MSKKLFILSALLFFSTAKATNRADIEEAEKQAKLHSNAVATTQILNKVFTSYNKHKDISKVVKEFKDSKIEVSKESRKFFAKEFTSPAPQAYSIQNQVKLDFSNGNVVSLEIRADNPNVVYINDKAVDISQAQSLADLKGLIHKSFKEEVVSQSIWNQILANILPQAHAGIGSIFSSYGGYIAAGVGLLLAMNDHKAIGLGLIGGGLIYQFTKQKDGSTEHSSGGY
ncbi:MAG: hypothetical protein R3A80_04155 [Bdellovibrionota bacterium]